MTGGSRIALPSLTFQPLGQPASMAGGEAPSRHVPKPTPGPDARLNRGLLLQVMGCVVPAMLVLRAGHPSLAARWLFVALFVFLGLNFILAGPTSPLSLVIAVLPGLTLLRDFFLYNSVAVLLAIGVGTMLLRSPRDIGAVQRTGITWLLWWCSLYWLLSFMLTGEYYSNLRNMEMVFAAAGVVLLSSHS